MRTILILTLFAAAATAGDGPPSYSYVKSVMVDPAYKSTWSPERIRAALEKAGRPPPRMLLVEVPAEQVFLCRAPVRGRCEPWISRTPLFWWGLSFRFRHHHDFRHYHRVARCR
ncbi:MAG: hypothetical protein ACT4PV_07865 [Planctomycetaceae bacterium]